MRILVNFMDREDISVHCVAEDARTPIGPYVRVKSRATLTRLLRYAGADDAAIEEVESCLRRWGKGSVWIDLAPGRKNLLRIRKPWSDGLE